MTMMTRNRPTSKTDLTPVATSRILFDATARRKAPLTFACGVRASAFAAVTPEDRHHDSLAWESAALDRYTRGHTL